MIYEATKQNSLTLYQWFCEKGYKESKKQFDSELFDLKIDGNKKYLSSSRLFITEFEGRITGFIQYGETDQKNAVLRLFYYEKGFEKDAKEMLFRASSYFYMLHLTPLYAFDEKLGLTGVESIGTEVLDYMKNVTEEFEIFEGAMPELVSSQTLKNI